jgi:hypothetical protein
LEKERGQRVEPGGLRQGGRDGRKRIAEKRGLQVRELKDKEVRECSLIDTRPE